jgi:glyoxylate reductase
MKPKVLMSSIVPAPAGELVGEYCDVELYQGDAAATAGEIMARIGDKDGLLCLVADRIGKEVIAAGPGLKVISTASVGYEHIDIAEATRRGIYVGFTPGVLTDATADLAFGLLLTVARRISEAERFVREGRWKIAWSPGAFLGASVAGATIGIVGLGRIGRAMVKRAKGFGMRVLYAEEARLSPEEETALGAENRTLDELLGEADFVSVHVPSSEMTYHLMNGERLARMKRGAILINTSRGPVVDEAALAKALKEDRIGGAGLDVFEKEPINPDNPLLGLDNVVLVPHIGSATRETRRKMAEVAAINALNVLKGRPPLYCVNPEVEKVRPLNGVRMI